MGTRCVKDRWGLTLSWRGWTLGRVMAESFRKRGIVWIVVGVGLLVANFFLETPLVLRGTSLPFWPFVMGLGVIILAIDVWRWRKQGDSGSPPP
jgi:hypothetical protein